MSTILFGRTQTAFQTPFESEPDRANGFFSKDVQNAIEEALALAIANDRFLILAQYNGNANTGRLLEFYSGIDSEDAPLVFGDSSANVLSIVSSTTGNSSNATIGFYDIFVDPTFLTPLYTLSMNGLKRKIDTGTVLLPLFTVPTNALLAIKIDSNSIQKPHLQIVFSSSTS